MKKKYINVAIVVLLMIAAVCTLILAVYYYSSIRNQETYAELSQDFWQPPEVDVAVLTDQERLQTLKKLNSDLFAWLKIPGTQVDYPVMQTKGQESFYLRRNFQKKYAIAGTPFADTRCTTASQNIILYGHNMKDGTMFSDLLQYESPDFVGAYPTIQFVTETETREYQIIAVIRTNGYDNNAFDFYAYIEDSDNLSLPEYTEIVMRESIFNVPVDLPKNRNLLSLSTCSNHEKNGRLLIIAAQI